MYMIGNHNPQHTFGLLSEHGNLHMYRGIVLIYLMRPVLVVVAHTTS